LVVATSSDAAGENVMADPVSISVKQLTTAAKGSVAKALDQNKAKFANPDFIFGFLPPPWILGIVIRNVDENVTLADAEKLATDVQAAVSDSVPTLSGVGKAGIIFVGGHVTIGFAPPPETVIQE